MSDLGVALEAMHAARHRYRTLRATIRETLDGELADRALERYAESPEGRRSNFRADAFRRHARPAPPERTRRLWCERPGRLREEADDGSIGVADGSYWWMLDSRGAAYSNEDDPNVGSSVGHQLQDVLDPSALLAGLRFELLGREPVAGCDAIRLRGRARGHAHALYRLGPGVRELELAVDAQRGVLLRQAATLDGRPYHGYELTKIAFDETLPPETFRLELPPGRSFRGTAAMQPREVSLAEAILLAPFRLFTADLPDEWSTRVQFLGEVHEGMPPAVFVDHALPDASHRLRIVQTDAAAEDVWNPHGDWDHDDGVEVLEQPRPGPTFVRIVREGTRVVLSGNLELEQLVGLVRTLRPAGPH